MLKRLDTYKEIANPVERAMAFSQDAHTGQQYGANDYTYHLSRVHDEVVAMVGISETDMRAAALLHDTLEDTTASYRQVKYCFGESVAELVYAVTDELGRNRQERHIKTYPKLCKAGYWAITLKLADRIANVSECVRNRDGRLAMYRNEQQEFEETLRPFGGPAFGWDKLRAMVLEVEL